MTKTYKFESGYTLSVRADYNPRIYNLTAEAWRENNPAPEPPTKTREVPIKGGTRTIENKDWSDPAFVHAQDVWQGALNTFVADSLIVMAIDSESLDKQALAAARAWSKDNGIAVPKDDVRLYLSAVAGDGEIADLFQWLQGLDGPGDALISKMLAVFQGGSESPGPDDGYMEGSNGSEPLPAERHGVQVENTAKIDLPPRG